MMRKLWIATAIVSVLATVAFVGLFLRDHYVPASKAIAQGQRVEINLKTGEIKQAPEKPLATEPAPVSAPAPAAGCGAAPPEPARAWVAGGATSGRRGVGGVHCPAAPSARLAPLKHPPRAAQSQPHVPGGTSHVRAGAAAATRQGALRAASPSPAPPLALALYPRPARPTCAAGMARGGLRPRRPRKLGAWQVPVRRELSCRSRAACVALDMASCAHRARGQAR